MRLYAKHLKQYHQINATTSHLLVQGGHQLSKYLVKDPSLSTTTVVKRYWTNSRSRWHFLHLVFGVNILPKNIQTNPDKWTDKFISRKKMVRQTSCTGVQVVPWRGHRDDGTTLNGQKRQKRTQGGEDEWRRKINAIELWEETWVREKELFPVQTSRYITRSEATAAFTRNMGSGMKKCERGGGSKGGKRKSNRRKRKRG